MTNTEYINNNKAAWEESFDHRQNNWGDDNYILLAKETLPFFDKNVVPELEKIDFNGKDIAQFCCNNGREILSLVKYGANSGVGFDIAENIITQGRETASKAGINNCEFVTCNILERPEKYKIAFDFIFFTVGAITWIKDIGELFRLVSESLRPGGMLMIHDSHPFFGMLPVPGEPAYNPEQPNNIAYSYFRKEPWYENEGMGYISGAFASKTFTSFTHTMSEIINSICQNGMYVTKLNEYDYDIGISEAHDGKGFPLSYLLFAEKRK